MLLFEESASRLRNRDKLGKWGLEPWVATAENASSEGGDEDCRICTTAGDLLYRLIGVGGQMGGFSHESEHDLAVMVSDFLENGSGGADSICSSDSDSGFPDLDHLPEKISSHKHNMDQYESDLLSVIQSLILDLSETNLHQHVKAGPCNASCIRQLLVKLLRSAGYDAAVCISKWQGFGKVPGGDHEYIDVEVSGDERLIVDIDFRSHFEIARAVESYDVVLNSLPVVYVGSLAKLQQLLPVMVEAARSSLKQNSMPFPPWRSLAYLQAKWQSPYQRKLVPEQGRENRNDEDVRSADHKQCIGHLRALKASLQAEVEMERLLMNPIIKGSNRRLTLDRWRNLNRTVDAYN
ncbi:Cruciferin BnC2 [Cinnamomum micranthum f. kanehirae]|uniref:Cruciferin BnC2 n=1 Tax=Cinnamomum micranthum f. kanehirae TaxID=337451 RepID=A0A443PXG0_9MAGN|nr:Cruciferin BnC2 [Cinnamomum micranthum f. kanehirae]